MKKYKFKLEPLLKLREFEEKQKFMEFSKVLAKVNENNTDITEGDQKRKNVLVRENKQIQKGTFSLSYAIDARRYIKHLDKKKEVAKRNNLELKDEYDTKLNIAKEYRLKRKTLEILKEKREKIFEEEIKSIEQKELDEFNQAGRERRKLHASITRETDNNKGPQVPEQPSAEEQRRRFKDNKTGNESLYERLGKDVGFVV